MRANILKMRAVVFFSNTGVFQVWTHVVCHPSSDHAKADIQKGCEPELMRRLFNVIDFVMVLAPPLLHAAWREELLGIVNWEAVMAFEYNTQSLQKFIHVFAICCYIMYNIWIHMYYISIVYFLMYMGLQCSDRSSWYTVTWIIGHPGIPLVWTVEWSTMSGWWFHHESEHPLISWLVPFRDHGGQHDGSWDRIGWADLAAKHLRPKEKPVLAVTGPKSALLRQLSSFYHIFLCCFVLKNVVVVCSFIFIYLVSNIFVFVMSIKHFKSTKRSETASFEGLFSFSAKGWMQTMPHKAKFSISAHQETTWSQRFPDNFFLINSTSG